MQPPLQQVQTENAKKNNNNYFLLISDFIAKKETFTATTVLGTCVAVVIWDKVNKIGGINHYMLPENKTEKIKSPKYGRDSINLMYEKLIKLGAEKKYLIAKVVGGAQKIAIDNNRLKIGSLNVRIAKEVLNELNIKIVAQDTGNNYGRKIIFNSENGDVLVKKIIPASQKIAQIKNAGPFAN